MGASNISITVKGDTDAVRKAFNKKSYDDLYQYGADPYNGSFTTFDGLSIKSVILDGVSAAHEYLQDEQQKNGPAFAVRYKVFNPNKTMENLSAAIFSLEREIRHRETPARKRASNEKKILAKKIKLNEWRQKKAAKAKRTLWLVGGWAAS